MLEALKKIMAAAEDLGHVIDIDILDFGDDRKMVYFEGVTEEGLPFELELKLGIQKEETEEEK